jgi:capsular exopolysaccharide synthesis family protein
LAAYLSAIRAHPWIFSFITLAAVAASVAFLAARENSYESTANVLVEAVPQEDQTFIGLPVIRDTGDPVRTAQTAASLLQSRAVADQAAEELGGDYSGRDILENRIQVNPEGESNILAITATGDSPAEAARLANEFSRIALELRSEELQKDASGLIAQLEARLKATPEADQVTRADLTARLEQLRLVESDGDPTLLLSEEAIPPESASGTPAPVVVVLALLAGLTLASGTVFLLDLLTRRVRDEDEAMSIYPLPVLARVPLLPDRSRRSPEASTWYMPPAIREQFLTLSVQLQQADRASTAVMVTSASKGDGKTTSAVNLAVSLATIGKRVVLLDFDLRKPGIGIALGMTELHRTSEVVDPNLSLGRLLVRPTELQGLRVLGFELDPEDAHLREQASAILPNLVQQARALADYVVVDTPPLGEVSDALRLGRSVDGLLVVMRPGSTSRSQLRSTRELLERSGYFVEGAIIMGASDAPNRAYGYGYSEGYGIGSSADLVVRAAGPPSREVV